MHPKTHEPFKGRLNTPSRAAYLLTFQHTLSLVIAVPNDGLGSISNAPLTLTLTLTLTLALTLILTLTLTLAVRDNKWDASGVLSVLMPAASPSSIGGCSDASLTQPSAV